MTSFVEIEGRASVETGSAIRTVIGDDCAIAVFNADGRLFAVDDLCVRCGSSLALGTLRGTVVCCSGCDWRYDVTTGCVNGVPTLRIDTFEVRTDAGRIMVATVANELP
jgi:nitrite reductase/ring-hydroxylating ferredoxin subunit